MKISCKNMTGVQVVQTIELNLKGLAFCFELHDLSLKAMKEVSRYFKVETTIIDAEGSGFQETKILRHGNEARIFTDEYQVLKSFGKKVCSQFKDLKL